MSDPTRMIERPNLILTSKETDNMDTNHTPALIAAAPALLAALRELIRCEDEAVYHSVSHHEAIAAARKALAAAGGSRE